MGLFLRNIIFLLLVFDLLKAQENIATFKKVVATTQSDSLKLEAYWLLGKSYRPIDQAISRKYIDTVQQTIAQYEKRNKKLLNYHLLFKANSLTTLANIEIDNDNLDESIKINLQCAKIYEQLNDQRLFAVSLSNIGAVFVISGKLQDAVTYLKKSARISEEILSKHPNNSPQQISTAETYVNLGGVYSKISSADEDSRNSNTDSSIRYYQRALQIYSKNKDDDGVAFSYNGMVTGYRLKKDFNKALDYANKALEIFKKLGNAREMSQNYINFSDIYLDTRNYPKAVQYADSVEKICIKNNLYENLMYTYETKMLAYEQMNDLKNQLKYFKKFTNLKDSLSTANSSVAIEELKTQYETEKKEKAIVKLSKDNEIKALQVEKDAVTKNRLIIIIIAVVVAALLLVWLAIFLQRTIKERKEAYIKLFS